MVVMPFNKNTTEPHVEQELLTLPEYPGSSVLVKLVLLNLIFICR